MQGLRPVDVRASLMALSTGMSSFQAATHGAATETTMIALPRAASDSTFSAATNSARMETSSVTGRPRRRLSKRHRMSQYPTRLKRLSQYGVSGERTRCCMRAVYSGAAGTLARLTTVPFAKWAAGVLKVLVSFAPSAQWGDRIVPGRVSLSLTHMIAQDKTPRRFHCRHGGRAPE